MRQSANSPGCFFVVKTIFHTITKGGNYFAKSRIAVVGFGNVGREVLPALKESPDMEGRNSCQDPKNRLN